MGRRYSFELFYTAAQVETGLRALHNHLPTLRRKRTGIPITSGDLDAAGCLRSLTPDSPLRFRTSLLFPADEYVRAFYAEWEDDRTEWDDEGNEYLPIGEVNVTVRTGRRYAVFTYAAVTSSMSDLFERSHGIWQQFDEMLHASGGLVALFNGVNHLGPADYPVLPDGRERVTLDFFEYVLEERDTYWHIDTDRYASAVLRATQMDK